MKNFHKICIPNHKKKTIEHEDVTLRDQLMANAYGGFVKKKVKRLGYRQTTDIDAGIKIITTPRIISHLDIKDCNKADLLKFEGN